MRRDGGLGWEGRVAIVPRDAPPLPYGRGGEQPEEKCADRTEEALTDGGDFDRQADRGCSDRETDRQTDKLTHRSGFGRGSD